MLPFPRNPKKEKVATPQEERIFTPLTRKVRLAGELSFRCERSRRACKLLRESGATNIPSPSSQDRGSVSPSSRAQCGAWPALRKVSLLPFVFVMYAYATGGPFGLEDMVTTSGPGLTLLYELFIPLFWCVPVSLVTAELTTAIPVEGGFYRWVRAGFGDFWGFLAGWWNWSASSGDRKSTRLNSSH